MKPAQFLAILSIFCCCGSMWAQTSVTALVTDVYDGDTLTVDASLWPGLTWDGSVRVRGIDAPEINGQCETEKMLAISARDYVRELLIDESVMLCDIEDDKYGGRVLAWVFLYDGESLAERLVANGYARAYNGGERQGWCDGATASEPVSVPEDACTVVLMRAVEAIDIAPDDEQVDPNHPLTLYDDNGNGRISCAEAEAHGIAPVYSWHPAYPYMTDRDGDGVVCE